MHTSARTDPPRRTRPRRLPFLAAAFVALCPLASSADDGARAIADSRAIYVKVLAPVAKGELGKWRAKDWVSKELAERGIGRFKPAGDWVRLIENGEERGVAIWDGAVDGKGFGCPAHGEVLRRTPRQVELELSGFAPVYLGFRGASVAAEPGSLAVAEVGEGFLYVAIHVGPPPVDRRKAAP